MKLRIIFCSKFLECVCHALPFNISRSLNQVVKKITSKNDIFALSIYFSVLTLLRNRFRQSVTRAFHAQYKWKVKAPRDMAFTHDVEVTLNG